MKKLLIILFLGTFLTAPIIYGQENSIALETIGAMGGSTLYLSYISIGTLADGYEKKVYPKEQAIQLVNSILNILNVNKNYIQKMLQAKQFVGEDVEFANKMIQATELLATEASAFINYAKTGDKKYATEFDNARKSAWSAVAKLLGFEK